MHVRVRHGRHLPALHLARAAARVEDHDLDASEAAHALDRRRAGVAGRRSDDRDALVTLTQHVVEEAADELQGDVLEGERRSMVQLAEPAVGVDLHERTDGGVAERGVRLVAGAREHVTRDLAAHERLDHAPGDLGVARLSGELGQRRPALRHVEAAVAREPCEQHVAEAELRGRPSGRDVAHGRRLRRPAAGKRR